MVVVTMMVMMAMMVMMVMPVMLMCFCSPVFSVLLQHVKNRLSACRAPSGGPSGAA